MCPYLFYIAVEEQVRDQLGDRSVQMLYKSISPFSVVLFSFLLSFNFSSVLCLLV